MINVRTILHPYLITLHPRTYFEPSGAPSDATWPYLVYNFQVLDEGEEHQILTLDVDGWDKPLDGNTLPLETLMSKVETNLDRHVLIGTAIVVKFYLDNKLTLIEDDKSIQRRKYIFQGRAFKRS